MLQVTMAGIQRFPYRVLAVQRNEIVTQRVIEACKETASATGQSFAKRSIMGTTPEVDTVTRRRDKPYP